MGRELSAASARLTLIADRLGPLTNGSAIGPPVPSPNALPTSVHRCCPLTRSRIPDGRHHAALRSTRNLSEESSAGLANDQER